MALTTSLLSGVTINEIHTSPDGVGQDYNGDGVGDDEDDFIELYNTTGSEVDIGGWEIWESGSRTHTFDAGTKIGPNGYYTVVDVNDGGGSTISNVTGDAEFSDFEFFFSPDDTYFLYDPDAEEFIVIEGATATNTTTYINNFVGFQTAGTPTQIGSIEVMPAEVQGESASRLPDGDTNWVSQGPTPGDPNCFLEGTLIATVTGEVAVEDLRVGDLVLTADGRQVPVRWIARQSVAKRFYRERARPVRIAAGALGPGVPHADLTVTADHGMMLDGFVVNASALVNCGSVAFVPLAELPARYTVFHVETDRHEAILANGAASESFVDYAGRRGFDNFAEYRALYGDERIIAEMDAPRISSARLVPPGLRAQVVADTGAACA